MLSSKSLDRKQWLILFLYFILLPYGKSYIFSQLLIVILFIFNVKTIKNSFNQAEYTYKFLLLIFCLIWLPMLISLPDAINLERSLLKTLGVLPLLLVGITIVYLINNEIKREYIRLGVVFITTLWCIDFLLFLNVTDPTVRTFFWEIHKLNSVNTRPLQGLVTAVLSPVIFETLREHTKSKKIALFTTIIATLHISTIILSGNRNAVLMMAIGISLWGLYTLISYKYSWKKISICALIFIGVSVVIVNQLPTRLSTFNELDSLDLKIVDKVSSGRLGLWESAARMSLDHWFNGVGPRGFRYGYDEYRPAEGKYYSIYLHGSTHPHFVLLEIFLETGIIGLISIIVAICLLFYNLRTVPMPARSAMFAWSLCVFLAIVPSIGKAFYSSYWLSLILYCIFMSISHLNSKFER